MDKEMAHRLLAELDAMGELGAAYRRAVAYGHPYPAAAVRIHGYLEPYRRTRLTVKAVDAGGAVAILARDSPLHAAAYKALLDGYPAGHYPVVLVTDEDAPDAWLLEWLPIPASDPPPGEEGGTSP
jgi:hypothetical protein